MMDEKKLDAPLGAPARTPEEVSALLERNEKELQEALKREGEE